MPIPATETAISTTPSVRVRGAASSSMPSAPSENRALDGSAKNPRILENVKNMPQQCQRIRRMSRPRSRPAQILSPVSTGSPSSSASARQARSPSDMPDRGNRRDNRPTRQARSPPNGSIVSFNPSNQWRIAGSGIPWRPAQMASSATWMAETRARGRQATTASAPVSPFSTAMMAELSSPALKVAASVARKRLARLHIPRLPALLPGVDRR